MLAKPPAGCNVLIFSPMYTHICPQRRGCGSVFMVMVTLRDIPRTNCGRRKKCACVKFAAFQDTDKKKVKLISSWNVSRCKKKEKKTWVTLDPRILSSLFPTRSFCFCLFFYIESQLFFLACNSVGYYRYPTLGGRGRRYSSWKRKSRLFQCWTCTQIKNLN